MSQLVRAAAQAYGDAPAIALRTEGGEDDVESFVGLERRSAELARALLARGMGKGSRVGFLFGNGPTFAVTIAAITRIGAIAVPVSTMIRANELVRVLRQSDVAGLIVQRNLLGHDIAQRLLEALPDLVSAEAGRIVLEQVPYLRWVVSTGDDLPPAVETMESLLAGAPKVSDGVLRAVEAEVYPTDQMIEIYTSGSMALPKGVKHNHGPVLFRSHYLWNLQGFETGRQADALLPFFWVGGLMMYLMPNWSGGGLTVCAERTLHNSRIALGTVMTDEDLEMLLRLSPKPFWGLGMSETLGPYAHGDELRAAGYPICAPMDHIMDGYEVRVADEENRPVADGETGEMQVRGYGVTPGLHKIERDTCFTPDGYYHTGDLCQVEGARIHFVGRNGEMIKSAGSNVSPAEVELELQTFPGVETAYVVGLPDKERGQLVGAAIIAETGVTLDFSALETEMRTRLSPYKVPRAWMQIAREDVPMLHSNKVARRQIAAMLAARLEQDA